MAQHCERARKPAAAAVVSSTTQYSVDHHAGSGARSLFPSRLRRRRARTARSPDEAMITHQDQELDHLPLACPTLPPSRGSKPQSSYLLRGSFFFLARETALAARRKMTSLMVAMRAVEYQLANSWSSI